VERQRWGIRIHAHGPSHAAAEERIHRIARAALGVIRGSPLLRIGDSEIGPVVPGPLAYFAEVSLSAETLYCITTHEGDGGDMGTAITWPLVLQAGSDYRLPFTVFEDGEPLPLTGYTIAAKVRESIGGPLVVTLTATITDAPNGKCEISLTSAQTSAIVPPGSPDPSVRVVPLGLWDCEITGPGPVVTRIFEGAASLSREVTT
jgi:hypothetical protein